MRDPEAPGFSDAERALLRAYPLLGADTVELALEQLRAHFDVGEDRGEIGQILHAYGLYRGLHSTLAALGAEILDADGRPLSEREGFGVVTRDDGSFVPRGSIELP